MSKKHPKQTREFSMTRKYIFICMLLVLITLVVFRQALSYQFIDYDDNEYVTENPNVQTELSVDSLKWAFTTGYDSMWQPITWISYIADWEVYGLDPYGYHLTNLLLHLLNVLLLFWILKGITGSLWRSAFVAALFAVHPLRIESVVWIAERKDVLSTFFFLLTIASYVRYARKPVIGRYLPVMALYALGLMSKPMLVTLPFALLLLDYWPLGRFAPIDKDRAFVRNWLSLLKEKLPLLLLAVISSAITYYVQQKGGALESIGHISLGARSSNAIMAYAGYLGKMLWPAKLAVLYPHPLNSLPLWKIAGSGLLLIAATLASIRVAKSYPYILMGWFWYVVTLIPVSGVIQTGVHAMADRFTYIPLIGIFIAIAWAIPDLLQRLIRSSQSYKLVCSIGLSTLSALVILVLMICTYKQVQYWEDSETLFQRAVDVTRNNYIMHYNLGRLYDEREEFDKAIEHYQASIKIKHDDIESQNNLGAIFARQGKTDEAIKQFKIALKINRRYTRAYYNWGLTMASQQNWDSAIQLFSKAVKYEPDYAEANGNLAAALYFSGRYPEAWKQVHICDDKGYDLPSGLRESLANQMPEPE